VNVAQLEIPDMGCGKRYQTTAEPIGRETGKPRILKCFKMSKMAFCKSKSMKCLKNREFCKKALKKVLYSIL
jgi:hypothetical protein